MTAPYSIYLHIPFCSHKCGYCDFNTYAGISSLIPAYVTSIEAEIREIGQGLGTKLPVHTIFFGGGTPSLLSVNQVASILDSIRETFLVSDEAEISLEANPGTGRLEYFSGLKALGVNRISMGVQSSRKVELVILEREHGYTEAIRAVRDCRKAGIENISLDLIYGLPEQKLEHWQENLERVLRLAPDHVSLYALTVEHGTPLASQVQRGMLSAPDPDLAAEMYEWTQARMNTQGFFHYEISNWAKNGKWVARHNLQYWQNDPYFGFGAGAHGYVDGVRTANVLSPAAYIKRLSEQDKPKRKYPRTAATVVARQVTPEDEISESLMMGLRLLDGYSLDAFAEKFGILFEARFADELADLTAKQLIEISNGSIRLTNRGLLLANQVFSTFV